MSTCQGCGAELHQPATGRPRKWCSERCRRRTMYSGPCADCGKPTYNGTNPPPERCSPCANRRNNTIWTPEAIVGAIQRWATLHGAPPVATDWNPAMAIRKGQFEKPEEFYASGHWPSVDAVQDRFGSWNNGIRAAGFEPLPGGNSAARHMRRRAVTA